MLTNVQPGTRYRFRLNGEGSFPDPYSRSQPDGVHEPSEVIAPTAFKWHDQDWRGVGIRGLVIYQLHVGSFYLPSYPPHTGTFLDVIDKVRPPYNVSALNAEATLFALEHADEFAAQAQTLRAERARLMQALTKIPGVRPFPSEANMILVRVTDSKRCFEGMKSRGVLVKNIAGLHPLLANCLRLTVGTPEENVLMIDALKASL